MESIRIVNTGLPNTETNQTILSSVLGQMSDGMWEETYSRRDREGYYRCADPEGSDIKITDRRWVVNPYTRMSDAKILRFFAKKIRQVCLQELKDRYPDKTNRPRFCKTLDDMSNYLGCSYENKIVLFQDAYIAAEVMKNTAARLEGGEVK